MGARLDPAERDRRAAERRRRTWSGENYRTYDTSEGFGDFDEWAELAKQIFGSHPDSSRPKTSSGPSDHRLRTLGLDSMPATLAVLKSAFRAAMFKAHPDHGGTDAAARAVILAYSSLKGGMK